MELTSPLRVVLADDHAPTRAGVREALDTDGCVVVADVGDGPSAVAAARELEPDVCVLDVNMPGSGIVAAREIRAALPAAVIVMLTASRDDADLFEALRAGAAGYLLKDTDPDRLGTSLRRVVAGDIALPRSLTVRVMEHFAPPRQRRMRRRPDSPLTERETQVLTLMREGLSTDEVAHQLQVQPTQVRVHVADVLAKLRVVGQDHVVQE